jgi:hypothetical protein
MCFTVLLCFFFVLVFHFPIFLVLFPLYRAICRVIALAPIYFFHFLPAYNIAHILLLPFSSFSVLNFDFLGSCIRYCALLCIAGHFRVPFVPFLVCSVPYLHLCHSSWFSLLFRVGSLPSSFLTFPTPPIYLIFLSPRFPLPPWPFLIIQLTHISSNSPTFPQLTCPTGRWLPRLSVLRHRNLRAQVRALSPILQDRQSDAPHRHFDGR